MTYHQISSKFFPDFSVKHAYDARLHKCVLELTLNDIAHKRTTRVFT